MQRPIFFSFILTLLFSISTHAQEWDIPWQRGVLKLNENEVLQGEVRFSFETNYAQVKVEGEIKTFTAYQFEYFRLDETEFHNEEHYFVYDYTELDYGRGVPQIFRGFYKGDFSLYARANRSNLPIKVLNTDTYEWEYNSIVYDQFLVFPNGEMIKLRGGNRARIKAIGNKKAELKEHVYRYVLDLKDPYDMGKLVEYYNSLISAQ